MNIVNLDIICAKYGGQISRNVNEAFDDKDKTENLITKSLGVLQEDGIYAFFLYLLSRGSSEKDGANALSQDSLLLLKEIIPTSASDELSVAKDLANNLNHLLLAKEMLERTLIYARYHAKALPKGEG